MILHSEWLKCLWVAKADEGKWQISHVHTRIPICPGMLATTCGVSAPADSSDKVYFRSFRTMHSSHMLREGEMPKVVRDILGHANIDVTQNVYGKSWWEKRVDAVTQAVEAVSRIFLWIRE